jgi:hypothetical protein
LRSSLRREAPALLRCLYPTERVEGSSPNPV